MAESKYSTDFVIVLGSWSARRALKWISSAHASGVLIQRTEYDQVWWYVRSREDVYSLLMEHPDLTVTEALQLHEYQAVPLITLDQVADQPAIIITDQGKPLGYILPDKTELGPVRDHTAGDEFRAYPAIVCREQVKPQESFRVAIGFSDSQDSTLSSSSGELVFNNVSPGDSCMIIVHGEGLTLDRAMDSLPLKANSLIQFTATTTIDQGIAKIKVEYYHFNQRVGYAEREIAVGEVAAPKPQRGADLKPVEFAAMVDVTLSLHYDEISGQLAWTLLSRNAEQPELWDCPEKIPPGKTAQFASNLLRDLRDVDFTDIFAERTLLTIGKQIAGYLPPQFWTTLQALYAETNTAPTVLLFTNESYIPWELAVMPEPLDVAMPAFLGAQVIMGRWLSKQGVPPSPPPKIEVNNLSVVFSTYGIASGQAQLIEAANEAQFLIDGWQAKQFDATRADLMPLLDSDPALDGHVLHFAVHGMSDVQGNAQALILADRKKLLPAHLLDGKRSKRGDPRFVFVFINACQVGTAGDSLGQVAGFPGVLLCEHVAGFLAPLWEAHDIEAREFAEQVYTKTLKESMRLGEALQTLRRGYDRTKSTTPIAYIFYGHPALKLEYA